MKIYGITDKGMVRKSNQDCFYISEQGSWCVIADGMGGHNGGETASTMAVRIIGDVMAQPNDDAEDALRTAIVAANNAVYKKSTEKSELDGMGTTVVLLKMDGNIAYIGHVGDSRAYYINGEKIIQLTKDHSIVQKLIDSGTITQNQAKNHPQKNLITRAVGTERFVEIDVNRVICTAGDYILLCTDGLSSMVDDKDIFKIIMENPDAAVKNLVDAANSAGGRDNVTAVLIKL